MAESTTEPGGGLFSKTARKEGKVYASDEVDDSKDDIEPDYYQPLD